MTAEAPISFPEMVKYYERRFLVRPRREIRTSPARTVHSTFIGADGDIHTFLRRTRFAHPHITVSKGLGTVITALPLSTDDGRQKTQYIREDPTEIFAVQQLQETGNLTRILTAVEISSDEYIASLRKGMGTVVQTDEMNDPLFPFALARWSDAAAPEGQGAFWTASYRFTKGEEALRLAPPNEQELEVIDDISFNTAYSLYSLTLFGLPQGKR